MDPREAALRVLEQSDPAAKAAAARALALAPCDRLDVSAVLQPALPLPGRPARPLLVAPATLPRRSPFTTEGRAALLHAVAHIEFNAIKTVYNEDQISFDPALPSIRSDSVSSRIARKISYFPPQLRPVPFAS